MTDTQREFDIIVWGASGFTGRLVAEYLLQQYGVGDSLSWAIAGRNEAKLQSVRSSLVAGSDIAEEAIPIVVADSHHEEFLAAMVERATVVCTTVGPYARYGTELVQACVAAGTHYCDLCGEPQWIRAMIDRFEPDAKQSGARIVNCCGFDSIPSDMGVYYLQQQMQNRFEGPAPQIRLVVQNMKGAASGGTVASLMNVLEQASKDKDLRRLLANPYTLNPEGERQGPDGRDQAGAVFNKDLEAWTGPFVMAAINTRVVRRSNAVMGYPYGKDFRYSESMLTGSGPVGWLKANSIAAALAGMAVGSAFGPTRSLLKKVLPEPGEGPDDAQREAGFYRLLLLADHPQGKLQVRVTGDRDPGYGSTSKMLGESAVCLAKDPLETTGGMWTPASAMGDALLARLTAHAGLTFEVLS